MIDKLSWVRCWSLDLSSSHSGILGRDNSLHNEFVDANMTWNRDIFWSHCWNRNHIVSEHWSKNI